MFGWVRVGSFDLDEAFRADSLIATAGAIEVRRIVEKAYRTFHHVLVQLRLYRLTIDLGFVRQLDLLRSGLRFSVCLQIQ